MTSHAIASGLSPVIVATRLGHGSTRMTMERYSHLLPGAQRGAGSGTTLAAAGKQELAVGQAVEQTTQAAALERKASHGDVAQLVEHLLCKQGVRGSNPLISNSRSEHL